MYLESPTVSEPTITVNGHLDAFTYLGSTRSYAMYIDDEVNARSVKTSVAFGSLLEND